MPAIICRNCGKSNLPEKRFCVECGQRLARSCAACGEAIAAGEKFCGNCGVRLEAEPPRREHDTPVDSQPAGERRHLTVLFADLVGSTQMATRLDPEEYHVISTSLPSGGRPRGDAFRRLCRAVPGRRDRRIFRMAAGARRRRGTGGARGPRDHRSDQVNQSRSARGRTDRGARRHRYRAR